MEGICRLTGKSGRFVKAHIIPEALTKPTAGKPFYQAGQGTRPIRRWTSWYDANLVVREGEDLLRDFDTWAISELRKHKLVWSGWGPMVDLATSDHVRDAKTRNGMRNVSGIDPHLLRLFFLSLLWRAAASSLPELREIVLEENDLEELREMVLTRNLGHVGFYPAALVQLSTRGDAHNMTPVAVEKTVIDRDGSMKIVPFFRFYFDGLIVHFHRQRRDEYGAVDGLGSALVGAGPTLLVGTLPFENSYQFNNLRKSLIEIQTSWPSQMAKIRGDQI